MSFLSDSVLYAKYYLKIFKLKQLLKRKGLDFTGRIEDANKELRGYEGCYNINGILKKLDITPKDKVLDIGCGKGLFLWYASKFDFGAIDGLEYSKELYNIAKTNLKIIKNPKINVYHEDARKFASYDQYNFFFLNNPFSLSIMQEVLEKKSIKNIDFNCDLAQAYGIYKNNNEFELLDYVSSVNVSCGFHAGDPVTIKEA